MYEKNLNLSLDLFKNDVIERQGKMGEDACKIMSSALRAVDPYGCVRNYIQFNKDSLKIDKERISTDDFDRLFVIGFGKASVPMALSVLDLLGDIVDSAEVITKDKEFLKFNGYRNKLNVNLGGHPIPTEESIKSTKSILEDLPDLTSRDIVIVLISGGGSALFTLPAAGVSLDDFKTMTEILLKSGAEIKEINTLRKHLDQVKGGKLAIKLQPSQIFTLILSDVIGDRLDMIASGPTVPDPTSYADASAIIKKYELGNKLPGTIISHIKQGEEGDQPETLKQKQAKSFNIHHTLVGSIYHAVNAGHARARSLGYRSLILSTCLTGETINVSEFLGGIIDSEISHAVPFEAPACLIFGGETTVKVTGSGLGGRNQDLVLRLVEKIAEVPNLLFISLATDGEDGPTDAAGAAIDGAVFSQGKNKEALKIHSFIEDNNSYEYLGRLGALIKTGATGTNVNDLIFIMVGQSE